MEALSYLLLVIYALCSATYSLFIKVSANRLVLFGALNLVTALIAFVLIWFVPLPSASSFVLIGLSSIAYTCMLYFAAKAYDQNDLSYFAPINAAFKFLLTLVISAFIYAESVTGIEWICIGIITFGILLKTPLGKITNIKNDKGLLYLAGAAFFSTTQFLIDIYGIKQADHTIAYIIWLMFIGLPVGIIALAKYRRSIIALINKEKGQIIASSLLDNIGYACILFVLYYTEVSEALPVSNLNIVFATLLGAFFLKEKASHRRIIAAIIITISIMASQIYGT
jgi:drug/metabolite transporter (DMT)-like permease